MCRYEWMRRALEQFLRVMASSSDTKDDDGAVGNNAVVVPADEVVVDDHDQIMNQMTADLLGETSDDHENTIGDLTEPETCSPRPAMTSTPSPLLRSPLSSSNVRS